MNKKLPHPDSTSAAYQKKSKSAVLPFAKISTRLAKIFQANNILTYADLTEIAEDELMKFRGISKGYCQEARRLLEENGMQMRPKGISAQKPKVKKKTPNTNTVQRKRQRPKSTKKQTGKSEHDDESLFAPPARQTGGQLPFDKIPARLANIFKINRILTFADLKAAEEKDLLRFRGIAKGSYKKALILLHKDLPEEEKPAQRKKTGRKVSAKDKTITAMFLCGAELHVIAEKHDTSQQKVLNIVNKTIQAYSIQSAYKLKRNPTKILSRLFDFPDADKGHHSLYPPHEE